MAGSFARYSITTAKAIGWTRTATPSLLKILTAFQKRCTLRTVIAKKECSATTVILLRTITETAKFTANRAPQWKSTASIATAPFDKKPRWSLPAPQRLIHFLQ